MSRGRGTAWALVAGLVGACGVVGVTPSAHACSCFVPEDGSGRFHVADGARIPADAKGIVWVGPGRIDRDRFEIRRLGKRPRRLEFEIEPLDAYATKWSDHPAVLLRPTAGLRPGVTYEFTARWADPEERERLRRRGPSPGPMLQPPTATVSVVVGSDRVRNALQAARIEIGRQRDEDELEVLSLKGSCHEWISANVLPVSVKLPDRAEAYRNFFMYRTFIDGTRWTPERHLCRPSFPGRSWVGEPGQDLVYRSCSPRDPEFSEVRVADGPHEIRLEVSMPGGPSWETPPVPFELACGEPARAASSPSRDRTAQALPAAEDGPPSLAPAAERGCAMARRSGSAGDIPEALALLALLLPARRKGRA